VTAVEARTTAAAGPVIAPDDVAPGTRGGHLELVSEFEIAPGGFVNPHKHPTVEYYLVRSGRGDMVVGDNRRLIGPGDLVAIPSEAVHSLVTKGDEPIRCFCFAAADQGAPPINYSSDSDSLADHGPGVADLPALSVLRASDLDPTLEHRGTVAVWWLVPPRHLRGLTLGGHLVAAERVDVFPTVAVDPTAEVRVYAVLAGSGSVHGGGLSLAVAPDDVIVTGPGEAHELRGDLQLLAIRYAVVS
jgi:mannose-6-phosphate isomerase-like protein (cupin superfamily)